MTFSLINIDAPHYGLAVAIENVKDAMRESKEVEPSALREAAAQLMDLAGSHEARIARNARRKAA